MNFYYSSLFCFILYIAISDILLCTFEVDIPNAVDIPWIVGRIFWGDEMVVG